MLVIVSRTNAQNIEIPIETDYRSIQFKLNRFDIKFQESSSGKVVISGIKDRSLWSFKKDDAGALVIEERDYETKLFSAVAETAKERLVIKTPALPLIITGTELDVGLEGIKNNIKIVLVKGIIKGFKTQGELRVFINSGEIALDLHQGSVFLNGSQVKFSMKNSTGDIKVSNHSGSVNLDKNTGHSAIFNYQGAIVLNQITGSSQVELSKGSVQITQSQGRHDIFTDEANVELKATKESDFNIKMKTGKLNFQSAGVTGAWLNLSSKEADIFLPAPLKPQRVKAEVFFKGRTAGEKSSSRLEVKSVNAPIIIR